MYVLQRLRQSTYKNKAELKSRYLPTNKGVIKQNKKLEKAVKDAGRALRTIEMQEQVEK